MKQKDYIIGSLKRFGELFTNGKLPNKVPVIADLQPCLELEGDYGENMHNLYLSFKDCMYIAELENGNYSLFTQVLSNNNKIVFFTLELKLENDELHTVRISKQEIALNADYHEVKKILRKEKNY